MAASLPPGMDSDSRAMLEEQVKKGKPRKFFLIYKGATVQTIAVFKKGPFGPRVVRAKKEGFKGDVLYGVVTGAGKELTFLVAGNPDVAEALKADGFAEEVSLKDAKLREFLRENDLSFKPTVTVISSLDQLKGFNLEAEDEGPEDEGAEGEGGNEQTPQTSEAAAQPPVAAPPPQPQHAPPVPPAQEPQPDAFQQAAARREALQQRFQSLQPQLQAAIAAHPDEAEDLRDYATEFGASLKINDLDVAQEWLGKLEGLLSELPQAAASQTAPQAPAAPPQQRDAAHADFEKRFAAVAPLAVPIAKGDGEHGQHLATLLRQAQAQRKAGDAQRGLATVAQIEQAVFAAAQAPPATPPAPPVQSGGQQEFEALLKQHAAAGVTAAKGGHPAAAEIVGLLKQIQADRNAAAYASGAEKLRRLAELLQEDGAPAATADLITVWRDAKDDADAQLGRLIDALRKSGDDYLIQIADRGLQQLMEGTRGTFVKLQASLLDLRSTSGAAQHAAAEKARQAVTGYRQFIAESRFLEVCDTNDLCGPLTIRATLRGALDEIDKALAS